MDSWQLISKLLAASLSPAAIDLDTQVRRETASTYLLGFK
jgi:hypothetical protein